MRPELILATVAAVLCSCSNRPARSRDARKACAFLPVPIRVASHAVVSRENAGISWTAAGVTRTFGGDGVVRAITRDTFFSVHCGSCDRFDSPLTLYAARHHGNHGEKLELVSKFHEGMTPSLVRGESVYMGTRDWNYDGDALGGLYSMEMEGAELRRLEGFTGNVTAVKTLGDDLVAIATDQVARWRSGSSTPMIVRWDAEIVDASGDATTTWIAYEAGRSVRVATIQSMDLATRQATELQLESLRSLSVAGPALLWSDEEGNITCRLPDGVAARVSQASRTRDVRELVSTDLGVAWVVPDADSPVGDEMFSSVWLLPYLDKFRPGLLSGS